MAPIKTKFEVSAIIIASYVVIFPPPAYREMINRPSAYVFALIEILAIFINHFYKYK